MGVTAAIVGTVATVGSTIYNAQQAKKQAKAASQAQTTALETRPNIADQTAVANINAARSQATATKRAATMGQKSTILTGPAGISTPPPARKTLLGQ